MQSIIFDVILLAVAALIFLCPAGETSFAGKDVCSRRLNFPVLDVYVKV